MQQNLICQRRKGESKKNIVGKVKNWKADVTEFDMPEKERRE